MQLTLSKSTIRSFRPSDAASLTKHIGTYSVARNMSAVPIPIRSSTPRNGSPAPPAAHAETHFAIAIDDEVVGGIGSSRRS